MAPDLNPYAAPSTGDSLTGDARVQASGDASDRGLGKAVWGLGLVCGGMVIMLVAWVARVAALMIGRDDEIFLLGSVVVAIIGLAIINVGPFLCLSVPSGYGLRSFAMATVWVQCCSLAALAAALATRSGVAMLAVLALAMFAACLFLFFIYRLTQLLQRSDLVRRTRRVSMFAGAVLFGFVPFSLNNETLDADVSFMIWIGYLSAVALMMVFFATLAGAVSRAVASAISDPVGGAA